MRRFRSPVFRGGCQGFRRRKVPGSGGARTKGRAPGCAAASADKSKERFALRRFQGCLLSAPPTYSFFQYIMPRRPWQYARSAVAFPRVCRYNKTICEAAELLSTAGTGGIFGPDRPEAAAADFAQRCRWASRAGRTAALRKTSGRRPAPAPRRWSKSRRQYTGGHRQIP